MMPAASMAISSLLAVKAALARSVVRKRRLRGQYCWAVARRRPKWSWRKRLRKYLVVGSRGSAWASTVS